MIERIGRPFALYKVYYVNYVRSKRVQARSSRLATRITTDTVDKSELVA